MLETIRFNLANLTTFRGRETRSQFWPYAAFVIILATVGMAVAMVPPMAEGLTRMQRFAAEHPELATVQAGPGSYSISIHGHHPELMPNMGDMMMRMDVVLLAAVGLLAAAVARRLHDRGKSGLWGAAPIPFIAFASFAMPKLFTQSPPDMGLFALLCCNTILYLASLITLIVMLAGGSDIITGEVGRSNLQNDVNS